MYISDIIHKHTLHYYLVDHHHQLLHIQQLYKYPMLNLPISENKRILSKQNGKMINASTYFILKHTALQSFNGAKLA